VVSNGVPVSSIKYLYDGWNLVVATNSQASVLESFMWGGDLSGSMQGAGGVGGLLEVSYVGSSTTNCFPAFDGSGNLAALVDAANGTTSANYEYGPFGEVIRQTGPMAKVNPIRFSTKYQDDESDLLYYGYRYYKASTGTWPSRDPIGEPGFEVLRNGKVNVASGGANLYLFVKNNGENYFDPLGLDIWVIRDKSGLIRHRVAVGNNADGSYWSSDFGPNSQNIIGRAHCQGHISFFPNQSSLIPTNLPDDYVIESHTVVDQGATDGARDYAKERANKIDQPIYDVCGYNCWDWANGLANYAIGRQLREDLDKTKNVK